MKEEVEIRVRLKMLNRNAPRYNCSLSMKFYLSASKNSTLKSTDVSFSTTVHVYSILKHLLKQALQGSKIGRGGVESIILERGELRIRGLRDRPKVYKWTPMVSILLGPLVSPSNIMYRGLIEINIALKMINEQINMHC